MKCNFYYDTLSMVILMETKNIDVERVAGLKSNLETYRYHLYLIYENIYIC